MSEWIIEALKGISPSWQVFWLSAIPLTELRASIPIGVYYNLVPWKIYFLAVLGNLIPIAPILWGLPQIRRLLIDTSLGTKLFSWIDRKTAPHKAKVDKFGSLGLLLFVAIPLPGTGVYTGALVAFVLGVKFLKAFVSLACGACIAGLLVLAASMGVFKLISLLSLNQVIVLLALIVALVIVVKKRH